MKELIEYIAVSLVSNPDAVQVTESTEGTRTVFRLQVASEDKGKVYRAAGPCGAGNAHPLACRRRERRLPGRPGNRVALSHLPLLDSSLPDHADSLPEDYVIVAQVMGPHGRDGCLNIRLLSDLAGRFDSGSALLIDQHSYTISSSRQTGPDNALLWLEGISSRSQTAPLVGKYLTASPDSNAELEEGEYFHYQLIGMQVSTEEGEALGEIQEILETGSNDVYIVRGNDGELLIPAVAHVVLEVDVAANSMRVRLPDGLR